MGSWYSLGWSVGLLYVTFLSFVLSFFLSFPLPFSFLLSSF